jgi:hypothetical protein
VAQQPDKLLVTTTSHRWHSPDTYQILKSNREKKTWHMPGLKEASLQYALYYNVKFALFSFAMIFLLNKILN